MSVRTYAALLRGINVGGHKTVPMVELRAMLEGLGFEDPRTLLQSGNAVFKGEESDTSNLEVKLEAEAKRRFGFAIDFVVRSHREVRRTIERNPFPEQAESDPSHLLAMFLKDRAAAERARDLARSHPGPEQIEVGDGVLYIWYSQGVGTSKLKIDLLGTARNWNTLLKIERAMRE